MTNRVDPLLGALVRRITHDLVNPLSAMVALADLASNDPLMADAVSELTQRLSFVRMIFGGNPDGLLDEGQWAGLLERNLRSHHVEPQVQPASGESPALLRATAALAAGLAERLSPRAMTVQTRPDLRIDLHRCRRQPDEAMLAILAGKQTSDPNFAPIAFAILLLPAPLLSPTADGFSLTLPVGDD